MLCFSKCLVYKYPAADCWIASRLQHVLELEEEFKYKLHEERMKHSSLEKEKGEIEELYQEMLSQTEQDFEDNTDRLNDRMEVRARTQQQQQQQQPVAAPVIIRSACDWPAGSTYFMP